MKVFPIRATFVLTQISDFWFEQTKEIVSNHIVSSIVWYFPSECKLYWNVTWRGIYVWVKKTKALCRAECIVRDISRVQVGMNSKKNGIRMRYSYPDGLVESAKLPAPIFTPDDQRDVGENMMKYISFETNVSSDWSAGMCDKVRDDFHQESIKHGAQIAETKRRLSLPIQKHGIGAMKTGEPILIEELLTPDSSRFWPT